MESAFKTHNIRYHVSELDRSQLYLELVSLVNAQAVQFVNVPDLLRELRGLVRKVGTAGRDRVDHRPGAHDDMANSSAGVLVHLLRRVGTR